MRILSRGYVHAQLLSFGTSWRCAILVFNVMLDAGAVELDVMTVAAAAKAPVWVADPVEMALVTTL